MNEMNDKEWAKWQQEKRREDIFALKYWDFDDLCRRNTEKREGYLLRKAETEEEARGLLDGFYYLPLREVIEMLGEKDFSPKFLAGVARTYRVK